MWILFVLLVVVLLLVFPRQVLPILAGAALLVGVGGGWHWWQERERKVFEEAVEMEVAYAPDTCSPAERLQLRIVNRAPRVLARVEWQFSARRAGYRGELTGGWTKTYVLEPMLAQGEEYLGCYAAPQPNEHVVRRAADELENLQLGIRNRRLTFASAR